MPIEVALASTSVIDPGYTRPVSEPSAPQPSDGGLPRGRGHQGRAHRAGLVLVVVGTAIVLWAVLTLADAGYGGRVLRTFAERRSYDMVKRDFHHALPRAILSAACGLGLIGLGARLRARAPRGDR